MGRPEGWVDPVHVLAWKPPSRASREALSASAVCTTVLCLPQVFSGLGVEEGCRK